MVKRLITAAIGIVIFFLVLSSPLMIFYGAVFAIILIGSFEINRAVTKNKLLLIIGMLSSALIYIGSIYDKVLLCSILVFAIYMLMTVFLFGKEKVYNIYLLGFASVVFSLFFSALSLLNRDYTAYAAFLPFLFAWMTDSGAYFAGKALGKHKLAKTLSPKKTTEGSIGGILACVVFSVVYVAVIKNVFSYELFSGNNYLKICIVSAVCSVISQFGDLSMSAIKREYCIKDYGNILPGHGGVLDRFDSVLLVTPFVYLLLGIIK